MPACINLLGASNVVNCNDSGIVSLRSVVQGPRTIYNYAFFRCFIWGMKVDFFSMYHSGPSCTEECLYWNNMTIIDPIIACHFNAII